MNTYEYVKELKSVGVPEEQAEVHAKALVKSVMDNVASKGDIAEFKWDTESRFADVNRRMEAGFAEVDRRMDERFAEVDKKFVVMDAKIAIVEAKLTMIQWAMGLIFGMNVAVLIKLFWPH